MKRISCFIICTAIILTSAASFAQNKNDSLLFHKTDSSDLPIKKKIPIQKPKTADSVKQHLTQISIHQNTVQPKDTYPILHTEPVQKPSVDTGEIRLDTTVTKKAGSINPESFTTNKLLSRNKFINIKDSPVYFIEQPHLPSGKEFMFYTLCGVLLILGLFKTFFPAYFKNLFRVYFNTSLRQTQLSDQLEQAKFPSFLLNIFFTITAGIYIWLLFNYFHPPRFISSKLLLPACILSMAALYFIKFCLIKFMGWMSDIQETTNNYIFAIFLVNKITGIVLVPVIILLAFLKTEWLPDLINISFMVLGLFFLSRYIKSYGVIERKIPVNTFHFLLYIAGAEIIPLFILYKIAIDYLI
ncbi:MAG: DUF4271 domain-containing protein [Ginsengibacter sp.]